MYSAISLKTLKSFFLSNFTQAFFCTYTPTIAYISFTFLFIKLIHWTGDQKYMTNRWRCKSLVYSKNNSVNHKNFILNYQK